MSLANAAIVTGGTISVAGGSAVTYAPYSTSPDQVVLGVAADTDLRLRRQIKCKVKPPRVSPSAPGGYTQARADALVIHPILLANGKYTQCTVQIGISFDPEMSSTEKTKMIDTAAQVLFDSDFTEFVKNLSLA